MNTILDANAILRYLLDDVKEQADAATEIIRSGAAAIPEVIAEVVYMLNGVYKVDKHIIYNTLKDLFEEVSVSDKPVILEALRIYSDSSLDYVDCVLIARARILNETVFSFDKKLNAQLG